MNQQKLIAASFVLLAAIFIAATNNHTTTWKEYINTEDIIGCAPGSDDNIYAGADGKFINVLPGWGNHAYAISTTNDSAQIYFNQGLSMYYSYHSREAVASFKEAARFDSSCAMVYWGQALAMGPSYNGGYLYKFNKNIPDVIAAMNRNAASASVKEKDLIDVMVKRYDVTDTADKQRNELNAQYAANMKPLVAKYPGDADIKALYVDAVMLIHAWDFWSNDGTPKPWTPELVEYCKDILKKDPHHPAGLHYYIHTTEASRDPQVALFCADSLKKLFPGVAHMVHMSSHEYERTGYYVSGVDANEKAYKAIIVYDSLAKGLFPSIHVPHYYAVDTYCALSGAMYKEAIPKAMMCRNSVKPDHDGTYQQYQYMFPEFAMVRMGKWSDILNDTTMINADWSYASVINDFVKGMACAKTGNIAEAEKHLFSLHERMNDTVLQVKFTPYTSSPYECSIVAENILSAAISFEQKKYDVAISAIQKAIAAEDKLLYAEPKQWMLPARQYLGAYLLQLNKPKEAEKVYREDLVWNPGNGWSLLGLYQSMVAQNKTSEATPYKSQYMNSFSKADMLPTTSAY
jgi:tetratricopeptide (TPR) repeat protein